ncbi:MAG: hypothetical protein EOP06_12485 [Proteobacteria bacterium]|nr:MAG: hypothetical protein EOP06_12485 [Pseudomonadota bacterium]
MFLEISDNLLMAMYQCEGFTARVDKVSSVERVLYFRRLPGEELPNALQFVIAGDISARRNGVTYLLVYRIDYQGASPPEAEVPSDSLLHGSLPAIDFPLYLLVEIAPSALPDLYDEVRHDSIPVSPASGDAHRMYL